MNEPHSHPFKRGSYRSGFIILTLLALFVFIVSIGTGPVKISPGEVLKTVLGKTVKERDATIVLKVRMPRAVLAFMVGAALAIAGGILQSLLRNPLADPYVLGVSSGSALGAVLALLFRLGRSSLLVSFFAFLGGLLAILIVYYVGSKEGRLLIDRLILAGVIVNFLFSAFIMLILAVSEGTEVRGMIFWLMGGFSTQGYDTVLALCVPLLIGALAGAFYSSSLNLLMVGEDYAGGGGVDVERVKKVCFLASALLTGGAVAAAGSIGFVGLIVPHTIRLIWGGDQRPALLLNAVAGGLFLVLADTVARSVISPAELPVGVITAFCGAPFFLILLKRSRL